MKKKEGLPFFVIVEEKEATILDDAETIIPAIAPAYPYLVKQYSAVPSLVDRP